MGSVNTLLIFVQFNQVLRMLVTYGNDHPSAISELVYKGFGHFGSPGGYDYGIKGAFVNPTGRTI